MLNLFLRRVLRHGDKPKTNKNLHGPSFWGRCPPLLALTFRGSFQAAGLVSLLSRWLVFRSLGGAGGFLACLRLVVAFCSLAFWSSAPWMVAFWRVCVCCPLGPALPVARQPPGSRLLVFGSMSVLPPAYRRDDLNCSCIASSFLC